MCASVLIVEDDLDLRELVKVVLELDGHEVRQAENGADAFVQLYLGRRPDLMLLNLWMPVVGGRDVIDVVRRDPALASLPVIVVTGAPVPPEVERVATAVIAKPFDLDALREAVAAALETSAGGPASTPPPLQL
jgi:CheY-like chemotaxis protein